MRGVLEELSHEDIDIKTLGFSDEEIRRLILDDVDNENSVPEIKTLVITNPGRSLRFGKSPLALW